MKRETFAKVLKFFLLFVAVFGVFNAFSPVAFAHCPLCTIGAGAVALGATWLGVSAFSVGIFLGAFAIAVGLWISRLLKKQYIPYQTFLLGFLSFLTTILPLKPLFYENTAILVSFYGDYGTWLNTTYVIDKFLIGSAFGAVIVLIGPKVSKWFSKVRKGKMSPFQGIVLIFGMLFVVSLIYEILA